MAKHNHHIIIVDKREIDAVTTLANWADASSTESRVLHNILKELDKNGSVLILKGVSLS